MANALLALVVIAILINAWSTSPVVGTEEGINLLFLFLGLTFLVTVSLVVASVFVG